MIILHLFSTNTIIYKKKIFVKFLHIGGMFFPRKVKFTIDFSDFYVIILFARADVMELADVTDSKSTSPFHTTVP